MIQKLFYAELVLRSLTSEAKLQMLLIVFNYSTFLCLYFSSLDFLFMKYIYLLNTLVVRLVFIICFAGPTILFFQENAGSILLLIIVWQRQFCTNEYLYGISCLQHFDCFNCSYNVWTLWPWQADYRYCSSSWNGSNNVTETELQYIYAFLPRVRNLHLFIAS